MDVRCRAVALVVSASLSLTIPTDLAADAHSRPLTAEQVECERVKLRGLLYLAAAPGLRPTTLALSPGTGESVGVLAVMNQWGPVREREPLDPLREPEVHLGATLVPTASPLLLNPERPPIDQLALARDDPSSTLRTDRPDAQRLEIQILATDSFDRRGRLVVDNESHAGATRPGRPLRVVGATRECGLPLTDEDRFVAAVLQRLLRPRFQQLFPYDFNSDDAWIAIYRAEEPDVFWIDIYESPEVLSPPPPPEDLSIFFSPNRFRLAVDRDTQGRLTTGALELAELRTPDSLLELFIAPPTLPAVEIWQEEQPPTVRLAFPEAFDAGPVTIHLDDLLEGTTWNPPRPDRAPPCTETTNAEYVLSGGPDPVAGIFVDDILRVWVEGTLVAEVAQGGGCCTPATPIRFVADTGDELRLQAQDANDCYSLEALWIRKADGSCLSQLTEDLFGPNCGAEPPEQIFFDETFLLP